MLSAKTTKPSWKKSLLLAATVIGACSSSHLLADDFKIYPGSYCRSVSTGFAIDTDDGRAASIENHSDQVGMSVTCPIVRDYMASDSGISRVRVYFHNNNTARTISCRLDTRHRDGSLVKRVTGATALGARQGSLILENGSNAGVGRSYALTCFLPATVESWRAPRIDGYKVEEFD